MWYHIFVLYNKIPLCPITSSCITVVMKVSFEEFAFVCTEQILYSCRKLFWSLDNIDICTTRNLFYTRDRINVFVNI